MGGAPSSTPYLTLPFCLSTMFFSVFAFRAKQERAREKRKAEAEKARSRSGRGTLPRLQSIRGAPMQLDVDGPAKSPSPFLRMASTSQNGFDRDEEMVDMRGGPRPLDETQPTI